MRLERQTIISDLTCYNLSNRIKNRNLCKTEQSSNCGFYYYIFAIVFKVLTAASSDTAINIRHINIVENQVHEN